MKTESKLLALSTFMVLYHEAVYNNTKTEHKRETQVKERFCCIKETETRAQGP